MITLTITMNVRTDKRRELLQTLSELQSFLTKESGYRDSQLYIERKKTDRLTLVEEWNTPQDVERYMQSYYFTVLRGALQLLTDSSNITFSQGTDPTLMEPILIGQYQKCFNADECNVPMYV